MTQITYDPAMTQFIYDPVMTQIRDAFAMWS